MKIKLITLLLPVLISCQHFNNAEHEDGLQKGYCSDSIKFVNLISATLELPNLQQYFKAQETLKQRELVIINNMDFTNTYKLKKFNLPIKYMSKKEITTNRIKAYLEYKEITIRNDTAYVYYQYEVQGVGVKSSYKLIKCQWQLINSHLWEN